MQNVVPNILWVFIEYFTHHLSIAEHSELGQIYVTWGRIHYWPRMASNVYTTISKDESCARNLNQYHQKKISTLSGTRTPSFIAIDTLRPFSKNKGEQPIPICPDELGFKLTRASAMYKTWSTHMANIFPDYLFVPLGIPTMFLTANGLQVVRKFFTIVCSCLYVKHQPTTAYHLQTIRQA